MTIDNVTTLPNDTTSTPLIRLSPRRRISDPEIVWEEVERIRRGWRPDKESLYVRGELADRILQLLQYDTDKQPFGEFINDPDCHGAAMYAMGMIDQVKRISASGDLKAIEERIGAKHTYEPQRGPVLVHLLRTRLDERSLEGISETTTPHSVIYLGDIYGHKVCYEKRGKNHSRFSVMESAEEEYKTTERLYVKTKD